MKRIATTLLLSVCIAGGMQAQSLKQLGTSVDDIVPQGWNHYEVTGDLQEEKCFSESFRVISTARLWPLSLCTCGLSRS